VLLLSVTTLGLDAIPAIGLDELDDGTDFHLAILDSRKWCVGTRASRITRGRFVVRAE